MERRRTTDDETGPAGRARGERRRWAIGLAPCALPLLEDLIHGSFEDAGYDVVSGLAGSRGEPLAAITPLSEDGSIGVVNYAGWLGEPEHLYERVWTLAHELGHLRLHYRAGDRPRLTLSAVEIATGDRTYPTYSPKQWEEIEANAFADELLCPAQGVFSYWLQSPELDAVQIAHRIGIPPHVVRQQLFRGLEAHTLASAVTAQKGDVPASTTVPEPGMPSHHARCLVQGRPGSGKTLALCRLVEALISDGAASPEQILVLAASRFGVSELRSRLSALLGTQTAEALTITTVTALGLQFIHRHRRECGLEQWPQLLSRQEEFRLAEQVLLNAGQDLRRSGWTADVVLWVVQRMKALGIDPLDRRSTHNSTEVVSRQAWRLYRAYEAAKRPEQIDAGDQILRPLSALRGTPDLAHHPDFGQRFRCVVADDVHGLSPAAAEMLLRFCSEDRRFVGSAADFIGGDGEAVARLFFGELGGCVTAADLKRSQRSSLTLSTGVELLIGFRQRRDPVELSPWHGTEEVQITRVPPPRRLEAAVERVIAWLRQGVAPGEILLLVPGATEEAAALQLVERRLEQAEDPLLQGVSVECAALTERSGVVRTLATALAAAADTAPPGSDLQGTSFDALCATLFAADSPLRSRMRQRETLSTRAWLVDAVTVLRQARRLQAAERRRPASANYREFAAHLLSPSSSLGPLEAKVAGDGGALRILAIATATGVEAPYVALVEPPTPAPPVFASVLQTGGPWGAREQHARLVLGATRAQKQLAIVLGDPPSSGSRSASAGHSGAQVQESPGWFVFPSHDAAICAFQSTLRAFASWHGFLFKPYCDCGDPDCPGSRPETFTVDGLLAACVRHWPDIEPIAEQEADHLVQRVNEFAAHFKLFPHLPGVCHCPVCVAGVASPGVLLAAVRDLWHRRAGCIPKGCAHDVLTWSEVVDSRATLGQNRLILEVLLARLLAMPRAAYDISLKRYRRIEGTLWMAEARAMVSHCVSTRFGEALMQPLLAEVERATQRFCEAHHASPRGRDAMQAMLGWTACAVLSRDLVHPDMVEALYEPLAPILPLWGLERELNLGPARGPGVMRAQRVAPAARAGLSPSR